MTTKTKVSKTYSKSKNVGRARLALLAVLISQAVTTWVEAGPMASGKANITEYPAPVTRAMPMHVGIDANSNVWFGEFKAGENGALCQWNNENLQHRSRVRPDEPLGEPCRWQCLVFGAR